MTSKWIQHVQATYKVGKAKGMSYKAAMQAAKKTWAAKKGAASDKKDPAPESPAKVTRKRRKK